MRSTWQRTARRRRMMGIIFLGLAAVLLVLGETVLRGVLDGWVFIVYWLACFVFTGLAVLVALWDWLAVRRQGTAEQRRLMREAMEGLEMDSEEGKKSGEETGEGGGRE